MQLTFIGGKFPTVKKQKKKQKKEVGLWQWSPDQNQMLECFQPSLSRCVLSPADPGTSVYSSKNEAKQADLHMEPTWCRGVMYRIVHSRHFRAYSGACCTDVWVESLKHSSSWYTRTFHEWIPHSPLFLPRNWPNFAPLCFFRSGI